VKKLLAILVLGLLWCNIGYPETLKFDCNYYSSYQDPALIDNLRIIDTEKKTYKIILNSTDGKRENYELPIKEFLGGVSRSSGTAQISLEDEEYYIMFTWEEIGDDHSSGDEYTGLFQKRVSHCFLKPIPIDMNLYRALYSPYVLGNCENFSRDGEDVFHSCLASFQQAEINIQKHKEGKCRSVREKIARSNARASSNAGNFLLGVMEGMWENLACDY
jgi:hypothetical protein